MNPQNKDTRPTFKGMEASPSLWVDNGNPVSTASDSQSSPQLCTDGVNGAIIAWGDRRSGINWDIYAQKINGAGTTKWGTNDVAICTATGDQMQPYIISDGVGGAIIMWEDHRRSPYPIYVQRVNAEGVIQWAVNGIEINTTAYVAAYPQICSDGANGAIIAWMNSSNSIAAQRIDGTGARLWGTNGILLCTGSVSNPQLCPDNAHGAIITWSASAIMVQRVNAAGIIQWPAGGIAIGPSGFISNYPQICIDGTGGAIITWQDNRIDSQPHIFAQRILDNGTIAWSALGISICTAVGPDTGQTYPVLCYDEAGGAIITWIDQRQYQFGTLNDIYAQRVNTSGITQWTANGIAICTGSNVYLPIILSDQRHGAIITWDNRSTFGTWDIYAQRVNASGSTQWKANGTGISTDIYSNQRSVQACTDDMGGALFVWIDDRNANDDIYANRANDPPTNFSLYSPTNWWRTSMTPTVVCAFDTGPLGIDVASVKYAYSRFGSTEPTSFLNVDGVYTDPACTSPASNGIIGHLYARVLAVPFNQDSETENTIRFCASDFIPDLGVQDIAFTIKVDSSVLPPIDILTLPFDWTCNNNFTVSWTNPLDVTYIYGAYYKIDTPPMHNTDGTFVSGMNITRITGITVPTQGVHWIFVWLRDGIGNLDFFTRVMTPALLDTSVSAPIGITASPASWSNINNFNVSWTNPGDLSGIVGAYYRFDRAPLSDMDGIYVSGSSFNPITDLACIDDGIRSIYIWLVDQAGNIHFSNYTMVRLHLDRAINIPFDLVSSPASWANENSFNVTWTNPPSMSGVAGAYYKLDAVPISSIDGTYIAGTNITQISGITVPSNDTHTVYIWLIDGAGNVNSHQYSTVTVKLDNSIGSPSDLTASAAGWTKTNAFNVTWINPLDASGIAGAYYKLDSAPVSNMDGTYVAGTNLDRITGITVPSDGTHAVYVWLVDMVGNIDSTRYISTILRLDTNIDAPNGITASPASWMSINNFSISWSNPADLSGIIGLYYKLDSAPGSPTDGSYIYGANTTQFVGLTVPADGTHTVYVWLVDAANNINHAKYGFTIVQLDTRIGAPAGVTVSPGGWSSSSSFNMTWVNPADLSGVAGAYYKIDSAPVSNTDGTFVPGSGITSITGITVSGDGVHTVYTWLVDSAGNNDSSRHATIVVRLDSTIGIPVGMSPSVAGWNNLNNFTITWTNPADLSGIVGAYYKLDTVPTSNSDGTYISGTGITRIMGITVVGDGAHAIYVWLVDAIGNIDYLKYATTTLQLNTTTTTPPPSISPIIYGLIIELVGAGAFIAGFIISRHKPQTSRKVPSTISPSSGTKIETVQQSGVEKQSPFQEKSIELDEKTKKILLEMIKPTGKLDLEAASEKLNISEEFLHATISKMVDQGLLQGKFVDEKIFRLSRRKKS